jgi:hypothetical protein
MNKPAHTEQTVKCPNGHKVKVNVDPEGTITLNRIKCPVCGKEIKMLLHRLIQ